MNCIVTIVFLQLLNLQTLSPLNDQAVALNPDYPAGQPISSCEPLGSKSAETLISQQVADFFSGLFSTVHWPARWYCGNWSTFHGWFSIVSDFLVWLSYFAIPAILFFFLHRKTVPKEFRKVFWLFIAFIMCCGLTHLMEVIIFWWPAYRLNTVISFLTASVSAVTVFSLAKAIPSSLNYKSPSQMQRLIDLKTSELQKKTKELESMNKELQHFAYVAAHDLKAPLANIESLVYLLQKDQIPDSKKIDLFDRVNRTIEQSKNKIEALNDVLEVKSITEDGLVETNVSSVLKDSVSAIDELIKDNKARIEIDIAENSMVPIPDVYLATIFQNLITNALKYRQDHLDPNIKISTIKTNESTIIHIKDNGKGIDLKKYGHKLFGLFQRFHLEVSGKGVGLYITKSLVENYGGTIEIESELGVGTSFRLMFPIKYKTAQ